MTRSIRTSAQVQQRARELRREMTPAEQLLWDHLRARRLDGLKFRRQHSLGPFIVDFFCPAHRLVVEIDGTIHDGRTVEDQERTDYLESCGYRVIRFRNFEVSQDIDAVLATILKACRPSSPNFGKEMGGCE